MLCVVSCLKVYILKTEQFRSIDSKETIFDNSKAVSRGIQGFRVGLELYNLKLALIAAIFLATALALLQVPPHVLRVYHLTISWHMSDD